MIAVVQRVNGAAVLVGDEVVAAAGVGLLALVAVHATDGPDDVAWLARKLPVLRVFRNADKHFDSDVRQVGGSILLVSNFTVAADARRGRRPSFDAAAPPEQGRALYEALVEAVRNEGVPVATGQFGADMQVSLVNDGPATFVLDSRECVSVRS